MSIKSKILSPSPLTFLIIGLVFVILPLSGRSPLEMIFVGIIDLLALLTICLNKFKNYYPIIKFSISIFNIIVFAYQLYTATTFSNTGYATNTILTMVLSVVFLIAIIITLLFYSRS